MTFIVRIPRGYEPERRYAVAVAFEEFLGLTVELVTEARTDTLITFRNGPGTLCVADGLFGTPEARWLDEDTVPDTPVDHWSPGSEGIAARLVAPAVPVLFGEAVSGPRLRRLAAVDWRLNLDVFGTLFFYLSRYEEVARPAADQLQRYPFDASIDCRADTIERPLVNEYVELLYAAMQRVWPGIQRRARSSRLLLSHDVDIPFQHAFTPFPRMLLSCGADWLRRREPLGPMRRISQWLRTKRGDPHADPANTFAAIMTESERLGLQSEFNFIAQRSHPTMDCSYSLEHPWICELLREIHRRGHRIGLHGSFLSALDGSLLAREFQRLLAVCAGLGISQDSWGGRQHWLRWRTPETFVYLDAAGLDYDSTLTYQQRAGFRCGTCYEYPVFDLRGRRRLRLRERPLIVMEVSVTRAMALGEGTDAMATMTRLRERCAVFDGDFTLLWHNSNLSASEWGLYRAVLNAAPMPGAA